MLILLVFAVLFLIGSGHNVYIGDYSNALVGGGISLFLFCLYLFFKRESKKNDEFLQWIFENQERIHSSGMTYENGQVIDRYTELTRYNVCLSFVIFTIKLPSRYYIKGTTSSNIALIVCTLTTCLLGWWGLPRGPVYTVQVIYKNLSGSYNIEVYQLLGEVYT